MKPILTCPYAQHNDQMNIECTRLNDACAHQRWCAGKGWCVLTDQAADCPARKDDYNVRKAKTTKKRRNKV